MKISLFPLYKVIFGPRKELLLEKVKIGKKEKNTCVLLFFGKEKTTELLIHCEMGNLFNVGSSQTVEYMPIKIDVINNCGETDGGEFIEWVSNFFIVANNRYDFNIYNKHSKDIVIKVLNNNFFHFKKFILCGCTVKNAVFYEKDKNNPQMTIEMAVKSGFIAQ